MTCIASRRAAGSPRRTQSIRRVSNLRQRERYTRPLGIDKMLASELQARPTSASHSKRPYVFGRPVARARYTAAVVAISQCHAELSERYIDGERSLRFPEGKYPPPILRAA